MATPAMRDQFAMISFGVGLPAPGQFFFGTQLVCRDGLTEPTN
jgi:hypothetical protein